MKVCPTCSEEFLDHVDSCGHCHEKLSSEAEIKERFVHDVSLSKDALLKEDVINFIEGGLSQCREFERILGTAKIASIIYPCDLAGERRTDNLGSTGDKKYMVLLKSADIERAKAALEGRFSEQVAKEGQGKYKNEVIDLANDIITCPACAETNPLKDGECPICGLFLGEPQGVKNTQ